ncbi:MULTISPECIES: RHS repeat-associated core domain-containing protein [unclassified Treponema]|uniref:RHS repeat-associated core domain-containing protein n=1 Tax=unclassified Treponema TaxID=2638727 RepID=UPI0020A4C99D|nr:MULTISPECIES: RHS repeat-associated core domain-containing protein [unclassified Treponema]
MKTKFYIYPQPNSLFYRTAIEREQKQFIKIGFAVHLSAVISAERYRSGSGALKSAMPVFVYLCIVLIVHKYRQSAAQSCLRESLLLNIPTDRTFGNRRSRYKELGKKVPQAYRVYVEDTFLPCDAGDARIFSKEGNMTNKLSTTNIPGAQGNSYPKAELDYSLQYEYDPAYAHRLIRAGNRYYRYDANGNITAEKDGPFTDEEEFVFTYSYFEEQDVYGADYGFGLDAPKETEQSNPQDLFAYRRNYTWNERNLLTKSSDRNYTVHYRYGEDGQRALKYTDEGRSETLYFNNFFTIHIPTQDQNNPQGLRVHKHIFVGNSRLVTAMTHTDNQGDNDEQKAKRYYYHSDHLGSAQFVTDWKGRQYEHIEYTPYGELWVEETAPGLDKLPFRFTGKELDEETGLYYYGARYLDPKYSRWLSGDPALGEYIPPPGTEPSKLAGMGGVYNTINLHLYHYGGNNPVKYIDPDGRSDEYTIDGDYVGHINDNIDGIHVVEFTYVGSATSRKDSRGYLKNQDGSIMSSSDFNKFTAAVYGETSGNKDESYAIADTIMNESKYSGRTPIDIIENTGIYGYNDSTKSYTEENVKTGTDDRLTYSRAAVIDALLGDSDSSNGHYFWEGTKLLKDGNYFYDRMKGPNAIFKSDISIGGTTFIKYNPANPVYGRRVWP